MALPRAMIKMMRFLYLHGFASGPQSSKARFFREQFRALGMPLEVLDLDEGDFERLTITGQLAVIDRQAKGDPVVLIGSSLGGYLSALYAARHREVASLILLAPAFRFPTHYPNTLGTDRLADWHRSGYLPVHHYGQGCERRLHYGFYADGQAYEPEPEFDQPALIIHGSRDDVVPAEFSVSYSQKHRNVTLHLVDSDHQLTDALETVWEQTSMFLRQQELLRKI